MKRHRSFTINHELDREAKIYCLDHKLTYSKFIENCIRKRLDMLRECECDE